RRARAPALRCHRSTPGIDRDRRDPARRTGVTHGRHSISAALALDGHAVRLWVYLARDDPHPFPAAHARARLHRDPGLHGARGDGGDERRRDDCLRLDLRSIRSLWTAGDVLSLARGVADLLALRVECPLASSLGSDLRTELLFDGATDDDAHREHLRPI